VRIVSFKSNTFDQFKTAIDSLEAEGVDGIIFDLRSNLGGYVKSVVDVVSYLIPDGNVIISYAYKNRPEVVTLSQDAGEDHAVDLPFVILCDYYTASSAEIFTAAMRDYNDTGLVRATIVGTTTYKKGVIQNTYYYPFDMSTVTLTVAYYKPPCGVNFDGVGIEPDVYVEYDGGETDNQLETGIEELLLLINAN
jgi:carboxyl-terminal processing protease